MVYVLIPGDILGCCSHTQFESNLQVMIIPYTELYISMGMQASKEMYIYISEAKSRSLTSSHVKEKKSYQSCSTARRGRG